MSGCSFIAAQVLGTSTIPASATPNTEPSLVRPGKKKVDTRRNRKRPSKSTGKRDGRARIIAALDPHEARTVHELARTAGVSRFNVYDHLPGLLEAGIAIEQKPLGHRAGKRYLRGRW